MNDDTSIQPPGLLEMGLSPRNHHHERQALPKKVKTVPDEMRKPHSNDTTQTGT